MKNKFFGCIFIFSLCFLFICSLVITESEAGLEWSGVVETELSFVNNDDGTTKTSNSDIVLATVELGVDADINESVKGNVVLLWEEDDTEQVEVDEGTITISNEEKCPFSLTAGKMVIPFGNFESHFVSDPLTLELAETHESALLIGYAKGLTSFSFGLVNGDVVERDSSDDDMINTFVANLSFDIQSEMMPITFGLAYITNIADTDAMQDLDNIVDAYVGGLNVFLTSKSGPLTLEAEYIQAMGEFEKNDLNQGIAIDGKKPGAWNVELAYEVSEELEVAAKYEGTMDQEDLDLLPESRYGIAGSYALYEATSLSFEYLHSEGYEPTGGGDAETEDSIVAQLAIEF